MVGGGMGEGRKGVASFSLKGRASDAIFFSSHNQHSSGRIKLSHVVDLILSGEKTAFIQLFFILLKIRGQLL